MTKNKNKIISIGVALYMFTIPGLTVLADGPGNSSAPGGPPGGSSSTPTWSGATTYNSSGTYSGNTYNSTSADENALLIDTNGTVTLNNPTVTKSGGTSAGDNYSFYGINSGIMCKGGGNTIINGGSVSTTAEGANGIFSYGANNGNTNATGDGTKVTITGTSITTTGNGSGGIMTTYGGTTIAKNLTVTTSGRSSAPIRTDRGGGWVTVTGGTYTSSGTGSPAIYSTADVNVTGATLVSNASEGTCIEGTGSITLTDCNLTATNNTLNGNATFYDSVMIYQSMSGDASSGTSSFTMTGGSLTSNKGHTFHVTNTNAVINVSGVAIKNSSDGVLLSACDDGWSGGSNIATFNASNQTLEGDVLVGSNSTLKMTLSDSSVFTGKTSGNITNAKGTAVSSAIGSVSMTIGSGCTWTLTGDSYVTSLTNNGTINTNGYKLYVNGKDYSSDGSSDTSENTNTETVTTSDTITKGSKVTTTDSNGNRVRYTVTSDSEKTVSFYLLKASSSSVTIPSTVSINGTTYKVTSIADKGLTKGKKKITSLTIGENVKTIGAKALYNLSKLKRIRINSGSISSIDSNAFTNIKSNAVIRIKTSAKKYKKIKKLIAAAGAPSTVTYKRVKT